MPVLLALALVALPPAAASPPQAQTAPVAFSGTRAHQDVDVLAAQIGSRPAGSDSYEQAVRYAVYQLQQAGYAPTLQTFPVETYVDRGSTLQLPDQGEAVVATTLQYSVGGQVEGRLVDAGLGRPEDIGGVDLQGKVALIKRGGLRFSDKVANTAAAGAVGAVVYNDSPGAVQGTLADRQPIPAATVSGADGQRLLDRLAAAGGELVARLTVDGAIEQRSATNVVAEQAGEEPNAGTVVFGAHLDSVAAGPGANDNGSGSAVVLELARVLAERHAALGLRFVLFGAEELGLFGSQHYVQGLSPAERSATRAMINLDMVGVGQAWRLGGTDELVQLGLGATSAMGERALPLHGSLASASDHASFLAAGVPALFIYRVEDPNYHTAADRAELVDAAALEQAGTIALHVLDALAAGQ